MRSACKTPRFDLDPVLRKATRADTMRRQLEHQSALITSGGGLIAKAATTINQNSTYLLREGLRARKSAAGRGSRRTAFAKPVWERPHKAGSINIVLISRHVPDVRSFARSLLETPVTPTG